MKPACHGGWNRRYIVVVLIAVALAGCTAKPGEPPDLPASEVQAVDIRLDDWAGSQKAAEVSSTDAVKIKVLLAILQAGEATQEHKCAASGKITLHYKDGSMVNLDILAGHDRRFYEFRVYRIGSNRSIDGIYRTDRVRFLKAIAGFGLEELDLG